MDGAPDSYRETSHVHLIIGTKGNHKLSLECSNYESTAVLSLQLRTITYIIKTIYEQEWL
jgi:hypothetical protein